MHEKIRSWYDFFCPWKLLWVVGLHITSCMEFSPIIYFGQTFHFHAWEFHFHAWKFYFHSCMNFLSHNFCMYETFPMSLWQSFWSSENREKLIFNRNSYSMAFLPIFIIHITLDSYFKWSVSSENSEMKCSGCICTKWPCRFRKR